MIQSGSWQRGVVGRRSLDSAMFVTTAKDVGLKSHEHDEIKVALRITERRFEYRAEAIILARVSE
jgi:hypothetical protein